LIDTHHCVTSESVSFNIFSSTEFLAFIDPGNCFTMELRELSIEHANRILRIRNQIKMFKSKNASMSRQTDSQRGFN